MAIRVTALLSMETCLDSLAIQENDALLNCMCPGDVCINVGVGRVPPSTLPARFLQLSGVCGVAGLDKVDEFSLLVIQRKVMQKQMLKSVTGDIIWNRILYSSDRESEVGFRPVFD